MPYDSIVSVRRHTKTPNMLLASMQNRTFRRGETVDFAYVLLCCSFTALHRMHHSALHIPGLCEVTGTNTRHCVYIYIYIYIYYTCICVSTKYFAFLWHGLTLSYASDVRSSSLTLLLKAGCAPCLAGCKCYGICTFWIENLLFEVTL